MLKKMPILLKVHCLIVLFCFLFLSFVLHPLYLHLLLRSGVASDLLLYFISPFLGPAFSAAYLLAENPELPAIKNRAIKDTYQPQPKDLLSYVLVPFGAGNLFFLRARACFVMFHCSLQSWVEMEVLLELLMPHVYIHMYIIYIYIYIYITYPPHPFILSSVGSSVIFIRLATCF